MKWFKQVILDVLVTALILVAVLLRPEWARWIVIIYTPIMLLLKVFSVFGTGITAQIKRSDAAVPGWFWHILYTVNTAALLVVGWLLSDARWALITGIQWVLIWILSVVAESRTRARIKAKKAGSKK